MNIFVTAFTWGWDLIGSVEVEVDDRCTRMELHGHCRAAAGELLRTRQIKDVHLTVTAGRPVTVEEARSVYGDSAQIEEWADEGVMVLRCDPQSRPIEEMSE